MKWSLRKDQQMRKKELTCNVFSWKGGLVKKKTLDQVLFKDRTCQQFMNIKYRERKDRKTGSKN